MIVIWNILILLVGTKPERSLLLLGSGCKTPVCESTWDPISTPHRTLYREEGHGPMSV
jgi:hypothetical protein